MRGRLMIILMVWRRVPFSSRLLRWCWDNMKGALDFLWLGKGMIMPKFLFDIVDDRFADRI